MSLSAAIPFSCSSIFTASTISWVMRPPPFVSGQQIRAADRRAAGSLTAPSAGLDADALVVRVGQAAGEALVAGDLLAWS